MNKQGAAETFDFTASFQKTLDMFEKLNNSSLADYERAKLKRQQQGKPEVGGAEGIHDAK